VVAEKTGGKDKFFFSTSAFNPDIFSKLKVPKACAILTAAEAFSQTTRA
jgi:hypothetical protein